MRAEQKRRCLDVFVLILGKHTLSCKIGFITVLETISMIWQPCEKLESLYENLMSRNFRKMVVLKKKNEL